MRNVRTKYSLRVHAGLGHGAQRLCARGLRGGQHVPGDGRLGDRVVPGVFADVVHIVALLGVNFKNTLDQIFHLQRGINQIEREGVNGA